jgi:hypothetical protein
MTDIEKVKMPEASYNDIASILDQNYGEVSLESLDERTFAIFLATAIEAAYRVGFRDGAASVNSKEHDAAKP